MQDYSDVDRWLQTLLDGNELTEAECMQLTAKGKEILSNEQNVQPVQCPVTVCGDIHGQHLDLLELFRVGGQPPGE
jgi:serine/threonine-protein phosphatase 2A catalytic subunit